ncbi:MAG: NAD(P)-dependent oxidoreductase [Acidobacteriaceae bacterium]
MKDDTISTQNTQLGFIGLGLMGSRLMRRLNSMGWRVQGWNRTEAPTLPLKRMGLNIVDNLPALVHTSDVLLSSLTNDDAVRAVYLAPEGVFASVHPETIILEMSTISSELSARLHEKAAERRAYLIDLPVSGSTPAVEAGTITLFAGGQQEIFDHCIPIFQSIAKRWYRMGPATAGIRMKLVVNLLLGVNMVAIAEAVSLGQHLDLDRDTLLNVLPETAVIAPAFKGKFAKIKAGNFSPEFPLQLMAKDMRLVHVAALDSQTDLPTTHAAEQLFEEALADCGELDLSAVAAYLSRREPTLHEKSSKSRPIIHA